MHSRVRSNGRRWPSGLLWVVVAVAGLLGGGAGPGRGGLDEHWARAVWRGPY